MNISGETGKVASDAALLYFQKKFPFTSSYNYTSEELQWVKKNYTFWYTITMMLVILFCIGLPVAYAWILHQVYYAVATLFISSLGVFLPVNWLIFCIPGLFLMCITIGFPIEWVQRLLLRNRYDAFEDYYNTKQGYDNTKAMHWFMRICAYPFVITCILVATSGIVVSADHFTVKHIYNLYGKKYPYGEVKALVHYTNSENKKGQVHYNPHYAIIAAADTVAGTDEFDKEQVLIAKLLEKRVPVDSVDTDKY
jgi:hypothetical protein